MVVLEVLAQDEKKLVVLCIKLKTNTQKNGLEIKSAKREYLVPQKSIRDLELDKFKCRGNHKCTEEGINIRLG